MYARLYVELNLCLGTFESIVSLRHSHGGSPELGASSDLLFVCLLRPKDGFAELTLQEAEIQDAKWVHYSEIDSITHCEPGTSAKKLMDVVVNVASGKNRLRISGVKLPAWRRNNCDQWIFEPRNLDQET